MQPADIIKLPDYTDADIRAYAELCDVLLRMKIEAERSGDVGHDTAQAADS